MEIKQLPCKTLIHKQLRWNELKIIFQFRHQHRTIIGFANNDNNIIMSKSGSFICLIKCKCNS